jgi:hypothetical protein
MLLVTLFLALIISNVPPALAQMEQGVVNVQVLYHGTIPPPTDVNVTRDPEVCGTKIPQVDSRMQWSQSMAFLRWKQHRQECRRRFFRTLDVLFRPM